MVLTRSLKNYRKPLPQSVACTDVTEQGLGNPRCAVPLLGVAPTGLREIWLTGKR
jgi:hypothetical protein